MHKLIVVVLLTLLLGGTPARADDWTVTKLRGIVLELVRDEWVRLERGSVVPDDRVIRTLRSGRVSLVRGSETVDLGPDTQIQIFDREGRRPYTRVRQYFGEVTVDAEARQVEHFAVDTPHLAAVVKGTRFVVRSGKGGSSVEVARGAVSVRDAASGSNVVVSAGQAAQITPGGPIEVSGRGNLPVVLDENGKPLPATGPAGEDQVGSAANAVDDGATQSGTTVGSVAGSVESSAAGATDSAGGTTSAVEGAVGGAVSSLGL